ncbi:MAG: hypothetical protein Mars2KO_12480 [Maribacter sp.]
MLCGNSLFSQVKNDFEVRYEADIRGELTFIANNIVNRQQDAYTETVWVWNRRRRRWEEVTTNYPAVEPEDPYDLTGSASDYNDNLNMQYIDVDSDTNTFSSSSATLDVPDEGCALIRYAGLYWSAVYVNPDRSTIDDIKFQVPGGAYQDLTADEILFDGDGDADFGYYSPYACYKDVTAILTGLTNPDGVYTVANVRASSGSSISGGISGGWTLVIVYENPNLPGSKYITTFDGYAGIASAAPPVNIPISGFTTLPAPFDVNAKIGVGALEGDNRINGDGLEINANGTFFPVGNTTNPNNSTQINFFNSTLSIDDVTLTARNPNSVNTLGWDVDIVDLRNNFNSIIPNDATSATLRLSSTQDKYDVFFTSFDVEIIAPNIVLEKRVEDIGGTDITGLGVNLGQELDYVLSFQNIGNDDATNYTIRDILPLNTSPPDGRTDFIPSDFVLPAGMAQPVYNAATKTLVFTVPDDLVNEDDPIYTIRMRVQVAENCFDFINACSDLIQNLAYSTYQGVENSAVVTDDPSVTDFDACGFVVPGATNFLLDDLAACDFFRTVELCGTSVVLDAGDGFDGYDWYLDVNEDGLIDAGDTLINSGGPGNDTLTVTNIGTYIVDKADTDPCKGFQEIIEVVPYGTGLIPNPVIEYFNTVNSDTDPTNDLAGEIVQCSVDNAELPKLFLCGVADTRLLQINIVDAQTILWEQLDESSCTSAGDDCANRNLTCTWNQVGAGNNYTVASAGKYRLQVTYQNGCTSRFYFNVFQNTLNVQETHNDILCNTPGNITVTNPVSGYVYRLVDDVTGAELRGGFSTVRSFDFGPGENGGYRVEMTQVDAAGQPMPNACVFSTPSIGILERTVTYDVSVTPATCIAGGTIGFQVTDADPNYEYEIRLDDGNPAPPPPANDPYFGQHPGGTLVDSETAQPDNNFTFNGLNPGNYFAIAKTDDGCIHVESVQVIDNDDLELTARLTQPITCGNGIITMEPTGGQPNYSYAILTYVDAGGTTVTSYPTAQDIPPAEYQSSVDFNILTPGDYTFVVVDDNNCTYTSNTVTIEELSITYTTSVVDESCFGLEDGSFAVNVTNNNGYSLGYLLTYPDGSNDANTSGNFTNLPQGNYTLDIVQSSGAISCEIEETFTIGGPVDAVTGTAAIVLDYTCVQNGSIQAQNVTGGTPPYAYSIDGINFVPDTTPGADTFTNLTDGAYTITIRDANNCLVTTNAVTLDPLNPPTDLTFTSTPPNCPALTSDVVATVVNGNTPFVFDIIAPAPITATSATGNTADFDALAPGTYTFRVTDDKGCFYTEDFTIAPVNQISVTSQLDNNISCFNLTDGAATFNVGDFNTTYDYSIAGPATFSGTAETNATVPLTGLAAGTYTITVTDNETNCTATADVTIAPPPAALAITALDVTDLSCSALGTVPGSVTVTAADGWGSYEYELEDPLGATVGPQPTASFTGLTDTSGAYTVTVRDAGGCEVTQTFSLSPTVAPVLDVTANSLCYDSATGLTLTASVTSGGEAPFQYRLNGGAYQSSTDFTGLVPGSHTVEVIDNRNCTATASIDVFPTLTATASLVKDLDCSATPDAEISINITGGNPNFTYEVFRNTVSVQASTAVPGIPFSFFTTTAGVYEFVITDAESCTVTTNQVTVSPNTPPTAVEVLTAPLCATSADGAVELQITGGLAPYQIVFDGSAPSPQTTYAGLTAGTAYHYTVTDAKGCVLSDSVTLTAPSPVLPGTIDLVTGYRCDNASATIQAINYSGGTPGYTFSIDGVNFQPSDTFNTGITEGTYTITVRDANGCSEQTPPIVIDALDPPTDIAFAQTSPTCPAVTADVTLNVTDGTAPFNYEIIAPLADATDNGNNNVFSALAPGTYTFLVTDDKGCTLQRDYTVTDVDRVAVISQLTNNVSCLGTADGAFTFTVSDFITTYSYTVTNTAAATVQSQNNINTVTPVVVATLPADTYTVTVTDDTTNCTDTTTITIAPPPAALDFTFTNTDVTCAANSTVTVTPIGGWGGYEYQLENTVGPVIVYPYQTDNNFADVAAGSYTIYIRDAGNCIVSKPILVDPAETPSIAVDASSDYCFDTANQASLTITITDGVAPFTYSINGGGQIAAVGNPFTISNLIPGSYDVQVMDAYGCISNVLSETIAIQLNASAVVTKSLDCTVTPDATIDVNITNGYPPYATYEVSTNGGTTWGAPVAIVGSTFTYSASTAGTYDFRITDSLGCPVITQAVIDPIVSPDITSLVQTVDILCNGDNGATIVVNIDTSQGVGPFDISVLNTTTATSYGTQTAGLPAGTYEVTITDAKMCTDMETIIIAEPDPITYDVNLVPITCGGTGTNPGSISVENVAGGTPGFTYHLTGNNGYSASQIEPLGADYTFTILEFGIYEVDVVDDNGCSVLTTNIIASPPDDLDIDVSAVTANCATGGTAEVTVSTAILGTNYEFGILDTYAVPYASTYFPPDVANGPTRTFTGLTPGITYTFVVHDLTTNCYYFETAAAPINSPSSLTSSLDAVNNVTCTGSNDGTVDFTIDNYDPGATEVTYEIFNSQSNLTTGITGSITPLPAVGTGVSETNVGPLSPGVYYILYSEVNGAFAGCTVSSAQFTITQSTNELDVTANLDNNDNCNLNAGQISAIGQFGTAPYEYQLTLSTDTAPTAATWAGTATNSFNVEGGDYIVYIKDAHDCIRFDPITVPTEPEPEITLVATNQCTADEGSFSVEITLDVAGISPSMISIDGSAPQNAPALVNAGDTMIINNLSSGPHSIALIDQNGCADTDPITLYPPVNISANITAEESCVPANAGEVTVTANGGSGTYSYTQITPAGPTNATGIFAGLTHSVAYTFEVEDTTTNCTETVSITLDTPDVPNFTLAKSDVSCFGGSDGSITVTLNPGNTDIPYLYSLDGGTTTQTSNIFLGRPQGLHNVTVISDKGCLDTQAITIDQPTELDISAVASVFSCDDAASTITVTVEDATPGNPSGTGPYLYSFDGGTNFQTGNTFDVPFGSPNVTVTVEDDNGCTDTVVVPVPVRDEVTAVINRTSAAIDCNNGQETIEIVPTSASGTYTYTELPSGNPVADPTNIVLTAPGTYTYEVLDTTTNCSVVVEHVIAPFDFIDVTATVDTDATCSDSTDGVIQVTITGYTGNFDYEVLDATGAVVGGTLDSDNATSDPYVFNVSTTLGAGTYSVRIIETAFPECNDTSNNVTIDAPEPLALQLISNVNANCNASDAIVTVQASGGTGPYTYGASQSGAGVPATFTFDETVELDPSVNLNWDIYVRDANNCIIAAPLAVTVDTDTVPDIALALDDECAAEGSFGITVSLDAVNFGVAPYTMSLDGNAFESIAAFPHTYNGLNAGPHSVEIRDANGCGETENMTINAELSISAVVVTQPTCSASDGVIEFTLTGGDASNAVTLLNAGTLTDTGLVPAGNRFNGVAFGDYIVRVTDTPLTPGSCIADAPVSLEEPTPVTLLAPTPVDVTCNGADDGSITVNLQPTTAGVNDNPPYTFEITDGTSTFTQTTNLFTGLAPGTWDITVTSNRNCVATQQTTINQPSVLAAAITDIIPFACDVNNAQQAAAIEVTITAGTGTPDYFYSVNGSAFQPTGGLVFTHDVNTAGNYDIAIRDANGCPFVLPTQVIDPVNTFTATVALSDAITCVNNREEVVITVTDDGNPHAYTYTLLPLGNPNGTQTGTTGNTATFELTAVGSYTFRITDTATGCYVDTAPYEIAPYDLIEVIATAVDPVICVGDDSGTLEIAISGYSGGYSYAVFNADGTPTPVSGNANTSTNPFLIPTGLSGGNYYVTVTETDLTSTLCNDDSNVITIVSPDMPLITAVTPLAPVTCSNDLGEILVDPSGGYPPYDIVLTNTTTGQIYTENDVLSFMFTGLSAGNFTVVVTDSARAPGCVVNDVEVLAPATQIVANATPLHTDLACFGDTTGTVTATVTGGGNGTYQYVLNYYDAAGTTIDFVSGGQSAPTFTGLGGGIYSVTVSDAWNCPVETNQVTIDEPTEVFASLIRTNPLTCEDGVEFELTAIGGRSGTYEYSLDNITWLPMTSNPMPLPATGTLGSGTHQYYVRDAIHLCAPAISNAITEDPIIPLELHIDDTAAFVNCNGDNTAIIYASANHGVGNYMFELYDNYAGSLADLNNLDYTQLNVANRIAGPTADGTFSGLVAGTYYVNVISGDCHANPQQVVIDEPEPLDFDVAATDVLCFGDENGTITVTPIAGSGGAGGYIYAISPNLNQFDTINTFTDLATGDYTIIAQDQNGCFQVIERSIGEPTPITASAMVTPEICAGEENGMIDLTIGGGTAPYSTRLSTESDFVQDRVSFVNMASGGYILFVRDANGCEFDLGVTIDPGVNLNAAIEVIYECTGDSPDNYINMTFEDTSVMGDVLYALDSTDPSDLQLNPDFRNSTPGSHYIRVAHSNGCFQDISFEIEDFEPLTLTLEQFDINVITATAEGGREEYTYYFDDVNNGSDNTFRINRTDTYVVRVVDANGCEAMASIEMEFIDIEIPNFFTPDGDGQNDFWMPRNQEAFPEILTLIFDRYGREVYRLGLNDPGWDGIYNDSELPTGDYWYVIKLKGENDDREFVGHFTLYR